MAVHLRCSRSDGSRIAGVLVSLRAVQLHAARIDDLPGDIDVYAERLLASAIELALCVRVEHVGVCRAAWSAPL